MPRSRSRWILSLVALVLLAWGATHLLRRPSARFTGKEEDPGLIVDRVWVDRTAERHTDYVHAMLAVAGPQLGVFQKASSYDLRAEIFAFKRDGSRLKLRFPQDERTAEITFTVRACADVKPPFDLCLDLSRNPWGGPRRYYGVRDADAEARLLGPLAPALRERALAAPR